jgi:hypothetical protein
MAKIDCVWNTFHTVPGCLLVLQFAHDKSNVVRCIQTLFSVCVQFNLTREITGGQVVLGAERSQDIPQCFSHFTYEESGRKRLVCDLQVQCLTDEGF